MLVCRFGRWLHGCLVKSITDTLNQKVLYDPSGMLDRPGVAVSTVHGGVLLGAAAALSRKRHGRHPQFIAGSQPQAVIVCSIMASPGKDGPDATDPGSPREPRLCGCSGIHGRTLQAAPCQSDSARCRRLAVESPEARTSDTSRWRR